MPELRPQNKLGICCCLVGLIVPLLAFLWNVQWLNSERQNGQNDQNDQNDQNGQNGQNSGWVWLMGVIIIIVGGLFIPKPVIQSAWRWIKSKVMPWIQSAWSWIKSKVIPWIQDAWSWIKSKVMPWIQRAWSWIKSKVMPWIQDAWSWIKSKAMSMILYVLCRFLAGAGLGLGLKHVFGYMKQRPNADPSTEDPCDPDSKDQTECIQICGDLLMAILALLLSLLLWMVQAINDLTKISASEASLSPSAEDELSTDPADRQSPWTGIDWTKLLDVGLWAFQKICRTLSAIVENDPPTSPTGQDLTSASSATQTGSSGTASTPQESTATQKSPQISSPTSDINNKHGVVSTSTHHKPSAAPSSKENKIYQVIVIGLKGEEVTIELCNTEEQMQKMTVLQLKEKIIQRLPGHDDVERLRLVFTDKMLDEDSTLLCSYGIQHMSMLHLVFKLPGGGSHPPPPSLGNTAGLYSS